jgi:pyruvate/2-oxoglutarate dehydrogenase complex dihydrolipoamide acyltransferase (E2) component
MVQAPGDAVKPGDNLFEIETDKVSMEVPSISAGTLTEIKCRRARRRWSAPWSR